MDLLPLGYQGSEANKFVFEGEAKEIYWVIWN